MASPSHRETVVLGAEELVHPLEERVFQLSQELTQTDPQVPALSDDEVITKLNMIAETLEEVETTFRKERSSPYRRDGHLIGNLLQVLEQNEDFYPMLEGKLSDLSVNRVKAATCRLLLATVPVNSRAIVRMLDDDEEMLERVCGFAAVADPGLRCYATGLLSVGLRDRSVADTVVNNDTPVKLLKRARMYASKLEKERQQAVKYIQDHLRMASSRHKKTTSGGGGGGGGSASTKATTPQRSLKRKHSDTGNRTSVHSNDHGEGADASAAEEEEPAVTVPIQQSLPISGGEEDVLGGFEDGSFVMPSPEHHEEDFKRLVMLELLYTLDCLGSMGEYLEIFAPALKEDIIGTVVTFLHSKNPAVISHTMTLTSHFLAHKKFSFSLVEAGGVDLLFTVFKLQQAAGQLGLLDRSLSMCLHGFASSSAVIERLVVMNPENMLSAAFTLLSSPNDRARQNAVVFFSLTLGFKVILDYFEKHNGLYTILNIIRYVRMHMALVTHRLRRKLAQLNHPSNRQSNTAPVLTAATAASRIPARVPKITWSKVIDLDDKTHEQNMVFYEKYRFSASSGNSNNSWSAASGPGGLWEANDMSALVERWRFKGGLRPQFNHYGDRIVALDARPVDEEDEWDGPGINVKGAVVLDIATADVLCDLKDATRSNDYGAETNCCFSPCDGTILTDGMLWDARIPTRALYKFDKLSNVGCGFFHPNGNEVIVNSAVWDLRTYRLLRMVPALDKCTIKFNPSGSVLFAYYPYAGGDYLERRKSKLKSWFRVLDSRDYKDITTIDLGRPVFDISLNTNGTVLSVVEGRYLEAGDVDDDDSICRLYDVGRKRPAEDDSDVEDGEGDSDTLDDDEYDDENSGDEDDDMEEEEEDTDEDEEETSDSNSDEAEGTEDEEGSEDDDDEDGAAHILAIEGDSGDEDGNGSILSTHDLGYLLELPDYYEVHQYSSDEEDAEEDE
ncbi:VPRBP protein [Phytophthora cinnamomi]|uniref:VPRBP protein n=1 Tax=Phytophthora cinnamomi TaxID=4785 RepID=UPI00355A76B9|nr:VPRBP protein [Phytophthora cinnamomi]